MFFCLCTKVQSVVLHAQGEMFSLPGVGPLSWCFVFPGVQHPALIGARRLHTSCPSHRSCCGGGVPPFPCTRCQICHCWVDSRGRGGRKLSIWQSKGVPHFQVFARRWRFSRRSRACTKHRLLLQSSDLHGAGRRQLSCHRRCGVGREERKAHAEVISRVSCGR